MKYLKMEDEENSVHGFIHIAATGNGRFSIEINHPWDGDSDSGFGREMDHYISKEQAEQLFEYLKINLQKQ